MAHIDAGVHQVGFEGETAANQKADQISVLRPDVAHVTQFFGELPVAPDPVQRQVGAQISLLGQQRGVAAGLGHIQHRAGLRVTLREQQKVIRPFTRQRDHVALGQTGRLASGRRDESLAITGTGGAGCLAGELQ